MSKKPKLRMTNADYVAIAVSPALIMALVGSLVFFLIEVLYVGQYQARLMYVFALFVFATVLIGRISIELGADRAALFALPLAIAMFLVLAKFVEHASPYSHLINIGLLAIVWWSTHKLTYDCTLIDDSEDASGEGLMQRIGVDDLEEETDAARESEANELFSSTSPLDEKPTQKTSADEGRVKAGKKKTPHAPGLWVLYFSLAALPLFGIGQKWIPASDVGRRQYAFGLLAIYVAAGLTLLVTTSFLGLRRYLRQRRVEMPAPMAATWVVTGVVLIGAVMLLAAIIPRPSAEYDISRVPWLAESQSDLASARINVGEDGTEDDEASDQGRKVLDDQSDPDGEATRDGENPTTTSEDSNSESKTSGEDRKQADGDQAPESQAGEKGESNDSQSRSSEQTEQSETSESETSQEDSSRSERDNDARNNQSQETEKRDNEPSPQDAARSTSPPASSPPTESPSSSPIPDLTSMLGGLLGVFKLIVYLVLGLAICFFAWKNRTRLAQAVADLVQQIQEFLATLFGKKPPVGIDPVNEDPEKPKSPPPRPFASFADPFASGRHESMSPEELVRHTFEAFEAWSREHGSTRRPDQTPLELVRQAVPSDSPMYAEAMRLTRLYGEAAYAPQAVSTQSAQKLARLWNLMRQAVQTPVELRQ